MYKQSAHVVTVAVGKAKFSRPSFKRTQKMQYAEMAIKSTVGETRINKPSLNRT